MGVNKNLKKEGEFMRSVGCFTWRKNMYYKALSIKNISQKLIDLFFIQSSNE